MRRSVKIGLFSCAILSIGTLLLVPQLIDDDTLRSSLEDQLTTALGHPVTFDQLQLRLLPAPIITLDRAKIRFGDNPDEQLGIGRIRTRLSWRALGSGMLEVRKLDIETLQLNQTTLDSLKNLFKGAHGESATALMPIRLHNAAIDNLTWKTAEGRLIGPLSVNAWWNSGIRPSIVNIKQQDGLIEANLELDETGVNIRMQGHNWTPPTSQTLPIEHLDVQARYADKRLDIHTADASVMGGTLKANGSVTWNDSWSVQLALFGHEIALSTLLEATGKPAAPGRVGGNCNIESKADSPAQLFDRAGLDCGLVYAHKGSAADFKVKRERDAKTAAYEVVAKSFTNPVGPKLHFHSVVAHGTLTSSRLLIDNAEILAYQGTLRGSGQLSWNKGWQFEFTSKTHQVQLDPLLAVFGKNTINGFLDTHCQGQLQGRSFSTLAAKPTLACDFTIDEGVLFNTDLERAAMLVNNNDTVLGSTPFDRLSGRFLAAQGQSSFENLQIRSSALEASGNFSIDTADQLAGALSVGLKNTGGVVSVPLIVSGSVSDPVIRPTKSAMAGGAAGTLILGPGVGTAIGVKVGEAVEKFTRWLRPGKNEPAIPAAAAAAR